MENPNFSPKQYIDATVLNTAFQNVSGNVNLLGALAAYYGGLISPESLTLSSSGLTVNITAPAPFGIVFPQGSGAAILAQAHGTMQGQDSQSYSVSFSGLVPASGSVTAYLLASLGTSLAQQSIQIVGPPPGHPDYNPNFQPYTAYTLTTDTLSLSASSGASDNSTNFEICRMTLAASATGVGVLDTAYQQRFSGPMPVQSLQVSGTYNIPLSYAGRRQEFIASGVGTLPAVSGANGLIFLFSSQTSGSTSFQTTGSDLIYGGSNPASGISSYAFGQGTAVGVEGNDGQWQIVGQPALSNLRLAHGECRLVLSGGNLVLQPYNGNNIIIDGVQYQIPFAGISLSATGLTAATAYYIYLYNNAGTLTLEASTTGHSTDTTAGNVGIEIKTGDSTRSLVGFWYVVSGPAWSTVPVQGLNWFNRQRKENATQFSAARTTTSGTIAEVGTDIRNTFLVWVGMTVDYSFTSLTSIGTTLGSSVSNFIGFDGTTPENPGGGFENLISSGTTSGNTGFSGSKSGLTEGVHYGTLLAATTSSNTATWNNGSPAANNCPATLTVALIG